MAGLRPFKFHMSNRVQWLEDRNGIEFHYLGISYSRDLVDFQRRAFSIEILVEPLQERTRGVNHILEIDDGRKTGFFVIGQWNSNLILRERKDELDSKKDYLEIGLKDVFQERVPSYLAITEGEEGISVYSNGKLERFSPEHSFNGVGEKLKGRLILGNSTTGDRGWSGSILRMSITDRELSEETIQKHYIDWIREGAPDPPSVQGGSYEYLFREGKGNSVNNEHNTDGELVIPETFKVLRKSILTLPWFEFHLNLNYLLDVLINILGFIPLGFILTLYLSWVLDMNDKIAYICAIAIGVTLSLAIEIVQVFIPVRNSSTGDLILNSLGTAIGMMIFYLFSKNYVSWKRQ